MEEKKIKTLTYTGLGFPIKLINAPMKKKMGEWVLDINFHVLQITILGMLATKITPLTGPELRFIIDYFEMSTRQFAKLFGVSHAAVLKWENEKSRMTPSTEICLRLYILNQLKVADSEFRKAYLKIKLDKLSAAAMDHSLLEVDVRKIA
jgi:DNA-binding transcriptional regulator YiaG